MFFQIAVIFRISFDSGLLSSLTFLPFIYNTLPALSIACPKLISHTTRSYTQSAELVAPNSSTTETPHSPSLHQSYTSFGYPLSETFAGLYSNRAWPKLSLSSPSPEIYCCKRAPGDMISFLSSLRHHTTLQYHHLDATQHCPSHFDYATATLLFGGTI